jgi:hypothetical protein
MMSPYHRGTRRPDELEDSPDTLDEDCKKRAKANNGHIENELALSRPRGVCSKNELIKAMPHLKEQYRIRKDQGKPEVGQG